MRLSRLFFFILLSSVLTDGSFLTAQESKVAARITTAVDETALTTLKGNLTPRAQAQFDQGEAAAQTQLTHLRLVLTRSKAQEAALDQLLAQQQNPNSPNYQKWLTPEQFGTLYGPADADITAIIAWLESHGLKLEQVSKGRTDIAFSGTVSQVEEALHTQIHSFSANGEQFYSNISDPKIPSALAPLVVGIAHLNTVHPRPALKRGAMGVRDVQTKQLQALHGKAEQSLRPDLTLTSPNQLFLVPQDVATIYDTPNTQLNINYASGTTYDGTGVNIGIGGDALILPSTFWNFRKAYLNQTPPAFSTTSTESCGTGVQSCSGSVQITDDGQLKIYNVDGVNSSTNAGDRDEAYLDTELSGGAAPGATIYYYVSSDLSSAIEQALDDNIVDIFSLSFGLCERDNGNAGNIQTSNWWQQAQSQGITVTVSTGDSGSAGCDYPLNSSGNNILAAENGLAVSGLASTPYNIAVGGTDFYALNNGFSTYVRSSNNATYSGSAKGYIPESTWNDSTPFNTTISEDAPYTGASAGIWGGSGGASSCAVQTVQGVCESGYAKPSWQTGAGVPNDQVRDIPDISLMAGAGVDTAAWLTCTDDPISSGSSTTTNCDSNNYFSAFGGTSAATPTFAGILALVKQKSGSRLGQAAAEIYQLANSSSASAIFHDVTVGNNSVPCNVSLTHDGSCVLNSAGFDFESGYNTTTGYDLATGWGSVNAKELINNWGLVSGTKYYTLAASNGTIATAGSSATTMLTVTGVNGYAGTVTVSCAVTASPAGAQSLPTCTGGSATLSASNTTATITLTLHTTAAVAALQRPEMKQGRGWKGMAGGFSLAFILFLGVPARRRSWQSMMAMLLLMVGLGSMAGCGSSGHSTPPPIAATTAGVYTMTVSAQGNDAATTKENATFNLTVN